MEKEKILVAIPYLASGAQGRELEYAVAGWLRHFKEDFRLVIVGDRPSFIGKYPGVEWLACPRIRGDFKGEYLPELDVVHKLLYVHKAYPSTPGVVWSNDDIYAVNDFDLADIKFLKCLPSSMPNRPDSSNGWQRMIARTREALRSSGLPLRNHSLHLPCWYEWDRLLPLIDTYDMEHKSYCFQNVYFNTVYASRIPFRLNPETDNIKLGVYRPDMNPQTIREAFSNKIWINNSVEGWMPLLARLLEQHYGL